MLKKSLWIAALLVAALAFVFVGCQDRPAGDGPQEIETNSLMFNTNNITWGGGIDLRHSYFNFAAGDKITVTGYMHADSSTSTVNINTNVGGLNDILRSSALAAENSFALDGHVLTSAEASQIAGGSPAGIRIDARAANAKVVLTEIIVEKSSGVFFKLSEYLDGLPAGPVAYNDTSVFNVANGIMDASGDGAVTYEIIAGTPVLPCTNDECRCLACDSKCSCWGAAGCFARTLDDDDNVIALGCCFVEDIYGAVDFTEDGYDPTNRAFFLNLNDYKQVGATSPAGLPTANLTVECVACNLGTGTACNATQLANHVLTNDRIKLNFTGNNQRVGFRLADWQADLLESAVAVKIEITGTAKTTGDNPVDSKTPFRFFIGDMKSGSNWNATDFPNLTGTVLAGQGLLEDISELTLAFNGNRNANTVRYLIFQQRAEANTTVEIESIKLTATSVMVVDTIAFPLAAPEAGAPAQTVVRGNGFTGDVTWYPTPANGRFIASTAYFASILINPQPGVIIAGSAVANIATTPAMNGLFYNAASQSIMTNVFQKTNDALSNASILNGDFDAALNAKFAPNNFATSVYSLATAAPSNGSVASPLGADGGTAAVLNGGVNYTARSAGWQGLNVLLTALGATPQTNVYKLTVFGIILDEEDGGLPGTMRLINSGGQGLEGYVNEAEGDTFMITYMIPRDFLSANPNGQIRVSSSVASQTFRVSLIELENYGTRTLEKVSTAAIPVNQPFAGIAASTTVDTFQYSGTVTWKTAAGADHSGNFVNGTAYTATVTLTAKARYTLEGVAANFFTAVGATSIANAEFGAAGPYTVTVVFPEAVPLEPIVFQGSSIVNGYNWTNTSGTTWQSNAGQNYAQLRLIFADDPIVGAVYQTVTIAGTGDNFTLKFSMGSTAVGSTLYGQSFGSAINTPAGSFDRIFIENGETQITLTFDSITFNPPN